MNQENRKKIGNRIDERMTELGLSNVAVAEYVGISKVAVGKWRKGETEPTGTNLTKLVQILKTNAKWITTGGSSKDFHAHVDSVVRDEPDRDVIQRLTTCANDNSILRSIPYMDAKAACGLGVLNDDYPEVIGRYEISEDFLARLNLPITGEGLILIESDGDSMKPSIPDKTPLLVNTKERDFSILVTGKIYVFCADGELICKRIYRNLDSTITLKSDNAEAYDDVTVNREKFNEFHILGRVKFAFVEM